jgi:hypothetical protein
MVDKVALGQVFSAYIRSPASSRSTNCSTLINDSVIDSVIQ